MKGLDPLLLLSAGLALGCGRVGYEHSPRDAGSNVPPGGIDIPTPAGCWTVTAAEDESDSGESATPPHRGAGLSLREAMELANTTVGRQCIVFARPMRVMPGRNLPALTDPAGAELHGAGVVVINGNAITNPFKRGIELGVGTNTLTGLEIRGFQEDEGVCVHAKTPNNTVGPAMVLHDCAVGVVLEEEGNTVVGNRIFGTMSAIKIKMGSPRTRILLNAIYRNREGVEVAADAPDLVIQHDTFHANEVAISFKKSVLRAVVENCLFVQNDRAIDAAPGTTFAPLDHCGFHANATACRSCTPGPASVFADPLFEGPGGGDFRLRPGSPAIDRGAATGLDVNGALPGPHNGAAPDLGAFESP